MIRNNKGPWQTGGRKFASPKAKPELPSACTISLVGKYTPITIRSLAELIPLIEIITAYADSAIQPKQYFGPFPALAMVYELLANASTNEMVGLVNKASVGKTIGLLAK